MRESHNNIEKNKTPLSIREQVSHDLRLKLAEYNDPKKGIKVMAMLMGIHEKTLKRLIDCENKPGHQTLLKIYRVLCKSQNDSELFKEVPDVVKEFILKNTSRPINDTITYQIDVANELKKNPVFCEIYFLLGTGGVSKEYVSFNYGVYGERTLEKMLQQKVAAPLRKDFYVLGTNLASLNGDTLSQVGQHLVNRFHKPEDGDELGKNYLSLYAQGLTEEAYNKWLEIDKKAYKEKVALIKDNKNHGNIRAFTFGVIDTLEEAPKDLKH